MLIRKSTIIEIMLGLGLGTGYMTGLRFTKYIGFSEILILFSIILLLLGNFKTFFFFKKNFKDYIKIYILSVILLQLPLVTLITYVGTDYNSNYSYIPAYILGGLLIFLISESVNFRKFDFSKVTLIFFLTFILSNIIFMFFNELPTVSGRYNSFSNNPNQLTFYLACLSFLMVIYQKKLSIIGLPIIIWIGFMTKSDAYFLSIFIIIFLYVLIKFIFSLNIKFYHKFTVFLISLIFLIFVLVITYSHELIDLWFKADAGGKDGGGNRIMLMLNGIKVAMSSPIVGWGSGSFSGLSIFGNYEAHSSPIDLAMQFGFLLPFLLYFIMYLAFIKFLKNEEYLVAAFLTGILIIDLFGFSARHFTFWIQMSIFYNYAFYAQLKKK